MIAYGQQQRPKPFTVNCKTTADTEKATMLAAANFVGKPITGAAIALQAMQKTATDLAEERKRKPDYQLRLRRFPVSYRQILEAVSPHNLASWGKTLVLKYPENIPADVEVVSVHEDHDSRVFTFTLRHWSFDPIEEGARIPRLDGENGECEVEIIDIAKRERERILQAIRDRFPANEGEPRPTLEMVIEMLENLA
jgi:hypothetical protein